MSRPKTKADLLELSKANYDKLFTLINNLDEGVKQKDFPTGTLNRNISDVLFHLHHWHLMMQDWYTIGMAGDKPDMPAKGYTWKTTPELNTWIQHKYKDHKLSEAENQLQKSYASIRKIIESHSDEELFEKKRFKWTGTTSLGAYLISATSSHYDWAYKLIKRVTK